VSGFETSAHVREGSAGDADILLSITQDCHLPGLNELAQGERGWTGRSAITATISACPENCQIADLGQNVDSGPLLHYSNAPSTSVTR
jgi:hypothetical protein